jgi:DNA invertase Pin-like site-specific DNA recombinase
MAASKHTRPSSPHIVGYARVSTDGQGLGAQEAALKAAGANRIFAEKVSGAKTDRRQLQRAIESLGAGDVLVVTRLDRLARSTRDLLNILHQLSERGVSFKSLSDAWADTTTPHGRLLTVMLGGIADFERELIRARTGEGRARAKANGVKFGAPYKLTLHQRKEALARLESGQTQAEIARSFNVDATTIGRLLRREEQREGVIHHLPVPVAASLLRTMRRT